MKPLILSFLSLPSESSVTDASILEYDDLLQLSVIKGSKKPAFDYLEFGTMTGTKIHNEVSDPDYSNSFNSLHSDKYNAKLYSDICFLLATKTITLSVEVTDEDQGSGMKNIMLGTMTMTRTNMESTDSDI